MQKKLNFHGWSDFKSALHKEVQYYLTTMSNIDANYPFTASDNVLEIAQKIAQLKKQAIDETAHLNDFATLNATTTLLDQATHIHVFALGNNLLISQEFVYNLRRINRRADIYSLLGEGKMAATLAQKNEAALIISYSGETTALVDIATILKQKEIPIVLITNIGDSSLSFIAKYVLRISTKEKLYSKISTFSTDASITYLLDVLYGTLFAKNYTENLELRKNTSRIMEISRSTQSNILKENE